MLTEVAPLTSLAQLRVLFLSDNQLYLGEEATLDTSDPSPTEPQSDADLPEGLVISRLSISAGTTDSAAPEKRKPTTPLRERLKEVQVLNLANNGLRSAVIVAGMTSLQHLDLTGNKIESVR